MKKFFIILLLALFTYNVQATKPVGRKIANQLAFTVKGASAQEILDWHSSDAMVLDTTYDDGEKSIIVLVKYQDAYIVLRYYLINNKLIEIDYSTDSLVIEMALSKVKAD